MFGFGTADSPSIGFRSLSASSRQAIQIGTPFTCSHVSSSQFIHLAIDG
jgi:hypothetical protein